MSAYSAAVADYFRRPVRELGDGIRGEAGSDQRGAVIWLGADVSDGILRNVGFRAFACPHIIAACNRVAEQLEGAPAEALLEIGLDDLLRQFEIPVEKTGKLLILKDAAGACYADYQTRYKASGLA
jgi:NifU-like protein involved in Fe-S cluster formation